MLWAVWLLVSVRAAHQPDQYDDAEEFSDDYDFYDEEEVPVSKAIHITTDPMSRVRRYGQLQHATRDGYDIRDVKDALSQLFSGRRMKNSYPFLTDSTRNYDEDNIVSVVATRSKPYFREPLTTLPRLERYYWKMRSRVDQSQNTNSGRRGWFQLPEQRSGRRQGNETTASSPEITTIERTTSHNPTITTVSSSTTTTSSATTTTSEPTGIITTAATTITTDSASSKATTEVAATATVASTSSNTITTVEPTTASNLSLSVPTATNTSTTTTTIKRTTKSTTPRFDIEALLDIVANLTYDYDTNLTQVLNETLQKYSIPSCRTPTTTVTTTTVTTTEIFYNSTVISKCFVCGLDIPGIPRNTFCSDAFATDFLPLVPIDPTAKGHIASFRKYCRYLDVNNYQLNKTDPRAMLGRWTGGCSVRWIDLSGVYTQRSCRNRLRPTTGLHFASKRMAKLELALSNVDNGCIISPMATLVPLSRGISLYARFHACVCTGNWCNRGTLAGGCPSDALLFFICPIWIAMYTVL